MRSYSQRCIIASVFFLSLASWSTEAANVHAIFPLVGTTDGSDDGAIVKQLFDDPSSSLAANFPPPQPRCWFNALKVFQPKEKEEVETLNKMCANMGPQEQQAFAFEIARCHLADMGRSIIETFVGSPIDNPQNCTILAAVTTMANTSDDEDNEEATAHGFFPNLKQCLVNLTQDGVNAYTYFFTQVVQLCNRLTEHLVADFREHTSMQLAKFSQQAVSQFNSLVQRFEEREEAMQKGNEDFYSAMHDMQQEMRESQGRRVDEFKDWTSTVMDDWGTRAQQQKEQQQAWFVNQTAYLESKAAEWGRQHWFSVTGFLASFINTDTVYKTVIEGFKFSLSHGYAIGAFLTYFAGVLYAASILTRPRLCRRFRGVIFAVICMEGLAELAFYFKVDNGEMSSAFQKAVVSTLRQSAFFVEALLYAVGLVFSCCGRSGEDYDVEVVYSGNLTGQPIPVTEERHRELVQFEARRLMQEAMDVHQQRVVTSFSAPVQNHTLLSSSEQHYAKVPETPTLEYPLPPPIMQRRALGTNYGNTATVQARAKPDNILGMGINTMPQTPLHSVNVTATSLGYGTASNSCQVSNSAANLAMRPTASPITGGQQLFAAPAPHQVQQQQQQQQVVLHNGLENIHQLAQVSDINKAPLISEEGTKKRSAEEFGATNDGDGTEMDTSDPSGSSPKRRRVMPEIEEAESMESSNTTTAPTISEVATKETTLPQATGVGLKDDIAMEDWKDEHSTDVEAENLDDDDDDTSMDNDDNAESEPEEQRTNMETGNNNESV